MAYVIDASVAVKWLVTEDGSPQALTLLDSDAELIAPRFLLIEVANTLWKKAKRGLIESVDAGDRIQRLSSFFHQLVDHVSLDKVLSLAMQIDHSVYDCIYLQTALDHRHPLVTADRRLVQKAGHIPGLQVIELATMDRT